MEDFETIEEELDIREEERNKLEKREFTKDRIRLCLDCFHRGDINGFHRVVEWLNTYALEDTKFSKMIEDFKTKTKEYESVMENAQRVNDASVKDHNRFVEDVVEYLTNLIM